MYEITEDKSIGKLKIVCLKAAKMKN